MLGRGCSHGAVTIVNAIACGRGAAMGIDLATSATVELTMGEGVEVRMDGLSGEPTALAERCVRAVLDRFAPDQQYRAKVVTASTIPVSKGLKSSSAAANAIILATLDALGQECSELDAVRMGTAAAIAAKVSVTGAFDDACASLLGGAVLTDNRTETLLSRRRMPDGLKVLLHVPDFQIRKDSLPLGKMKAMARPVGLAFERAMQGDYYGAMIVNGLAYSAALGLDQQVAIRALQSGALAAGLSGTGPATAIIVEETELDRFISSMPDYHFTIADIYNGRE